MNDDVHGCDECDVVILGGGPAGLSAALISGRQQRSTVLFDNGRYRNAPAAESHMYLGSDGASPGDIRGRGRAELAAHPNVIMRESTVTRIGRAEGADRFEIIAGDASTFARAVIVAAGQRDLPSGIPGLMERFGDAVVHCPFCHGHETVGKRIAVLSERPTVAAQPALQALYVRAHFSDDVVLCANGDEVPAEIRDALQRNDVKIAEAPIAAVSGVRDDLVVELDGAAPVRVDVGFHVPKFEIGSPLVDDLGCETDGGAVLVDSAYRTSIPGIYAAGDIARMRAQDVPLPFISQAVATGQAAALWCDQDLFFADAGLNL